MFLHFSFVVFVSACAGQSYNSAPFQCDQIICPPVPSMYIDLGCKPVVKPGDCCPDRFSIFKKHCKYNVKCYNFFFCFSLFCVFIRYECSSPRKNFCTFKGNLYSHGEKISIYDAPPCTSDCVCTR